MVPWTRDPCRGGGGFVTLAAVQPLRRISSKLTTPAVGVSTLVRRQVSAVMCFLPEGMVRSTARSVFECKENILSLI